MDATEFAAALRGWGLALLQVAGIALFIAVWYFRGMFENPGVAFGAALALVGGFMLLISAFQAQWVLVGVTAAIIAVGVLIAGANAPKR
jgi:hypothetical protein